MSIEVYLGDLLQLTVCHGLSEGALEARLSEEYAFKQRVLKAYALKKNLHNGATIRVGGYTYRNEGLYFWDAQNEEIVEPFTEIDDYGSVPPRFVVGDGYFSPNDWVDEVEHNAFVFPARPLMNEMKEFAEKHPEKKRMTVQINGVKYAVSYNPIDMKDKWDSCIIIQACEYGSKVLEVFPGDPSWRETIVDEEATSPVAPASSPGASASSPVAPASSPGASASSPGASASSPGASASAEPKLDSVVTSVLESFKQRAATGQKKYGTNLDRTDLKTLDWIQHMQEELMDATLYLEKLKREFSHTNRHE